MTLVTALHQIIHSKGKVVEPGTVFDPGAAQAELDKMGAIRPSTAAELALYMMANPNPVAQIAPTQAPVAAASAGPTRADLEARALKAGVTFRSTLSDEKLLERVTEAESMLPESDPDVVQNPTLDI